MSDQMSTYNTIQVRFQDSICFIQIARPEANNTINGELIAECNEVLSLCENAATLVVLSGSPEVFCFGADFAGLSSGTRPMLEEDGPSALYGLWLRLATGPYITVSHVRGRVNAGGVGFVAASDVVLADETAQFSLSELLFGLFPACVLPFLCRRVGFQRAHYLTLMTQPIGVHKACDWGLVDAFEPHSEALLRRHILRLRRIAKPAIARYKKYANSIARPLEDMQAAAVAANVEVFSDPANVNAIARYVQHGVFPWEKA